MSPEEREAFYDREVAPVLLELARKCQANGLSLVAMAEWAPGETGRTAVLAEGSGFAIRMTHLATEARGNVDGFIFALLKHAREHGHNSICLNILERESSREEGR